MILAGFSLALWPHRRAAAVERRIAEGDDRYFEEQRTYRERPAHRDPKHIRKIGIFLIVCGLMLYGLAFYGKV